MPPLFLILLISAIALVWGFIFVRRSGMIGGCLATIGAGSCLGHPFFHVSIFTLDRIMLALLLAAYLASRSLFGLRARKFSKSDVALIAFVGWLAVNTLVHDWRFDQGQPVATLLFFYLLPLTMYWIASRCRLTETYHFWILGSFAVFGVYLSVTALCEVLGFASLVFPRYITSPEHTEFFGRARGPFLNPIGDGLYMTAAFIALMLGWPHLRKEYRPIVTGLAVMNIIGIASTMTRSVWLGMALTLVGFATAVVPKRHRLRVALVATILGGVALAFTGESLRQFKRDKHVSAAEMAESAKLRPILAAYAYEMFRDNPVGGIGLAQYSRRNVEYLTRRSFDVPMQKAVDYIQHNVLLSLLVETGAVGICLYLVVLVCWTIDGWALWNSESLPLWQRQLGLLALLLLIAFLCNGMFHEVSIIPMSNMLLFFVAGLCRNARDQAVTQSVTTHA